jgi:DNA-binding NarL/FixJ family response regulator
VNGIGTQQRSLEKRKRIVVVDDHPIVRRGFAFLINQETDMEVSGEAAEAGEALETIERIKPDLAIIDITLKDSNGMDLIKQLKRTSPGLPILVVSIHDELLFAERALRAGARGYIMKQEADEKMIEAIHRVLEGGIYLSRAMSERVLTILADGRPRDPAALIDSLSDRELAAFQLIGQGYETRQIAEMLQVGVKTIDTYRTRIKRKLNLENANQLVQYAVEWMIRQRGV